MTNPAARTQSQTEKRAAQREVMGKRGAQTRLELLESLAALLETTPWRLVSANAVARGAGVAMATFYHYFSSVEEAFDELVSSLRAREAVVTVSVHVRMICLLHTWEKRNLDNAVPHNDK